MAETEAWLLPIDTNDRVAIGSHHMVGFMAPDDVTILPVLLSNRFALGVIDYENSIVPVIDLSELLYPKIKRTKMTGLVVIQYQDAEGEPLKQGAFILRGSPESIVVSSEMGCPNKSEPRTYQALSESAFVWNEQVVPVLIL